MPPRGKRGGIGDILKLFSENSDAGDVLLALICLLLYSDSGDEEFLFILASLFFNAK